MSGAMPDWAQRMGHLYRSGSASQFLLYGNVHDLVPTPGEKDKHRVKEAANGNGGGPFVSLRRFLTDVMFDPFDVVIHYDRGRGIRVRKGGDHFHQFLKMYDSFRGTSWAALPDTGEGKVETLDLANQLPRDARQALEVLDRFLRGSQRLTEIDEDGRRVPAPLRVAVVIDYAHFVAPQGDPLHVSGERSQILIRLLDWASDPALTEGLVATVLITENLAQIHRSLAENPYAAKLSLELPTADEIRDFVLAETDDVDFDRASEVSREALASRLVGLSRVNVRALLRRALASGASGASDEDGGASGAKSDRITQEFLTDVKKELIEKEAFGRITFLESDRTLEDVAGHEEAKAWLRQDAELLKRGRLRALPMGYLLCGRIGTGKTFLVHCWSGEVGVPVVEIKNFREKWVGATEANLERVFGILRALGQVIVFVDEADQATGKRGGGDGDSGLSGRVYGMLAREMSKTENRGKVIWVFATSRPDLVEVDLKRQGRLDVHIPLFPPGTPESRRHLFRAMARKVGLEISMEDLPDPPDNEQIGGNEMEGILVRALRLYETQPEGDDRKGLPEVIREVLKDVRSSAHVERLQLMDMLAVKECTDTRFLPPRFAELSLGEVNRRIDELRMQVGE